MPRARALAALACLAIILVPASPRAAPAPGSLTPKGCIQDVGRSDCPVTQQGLDEGVAVAVSPDGRSVYAVSFADDAIVWFDRDTTTGALTPRACIQDVGRGDCGVNQQGLDGPQAIDVSLDGRSVYVAALGDDAVVHLRRDPVSGALTPAGCIQDFARLDCGTMQQGLDEVDGVAVSPDGRSVYAASFTDDAIVRFDRNTTNGALTPAGCIQDAGRLECGATQQGLDGAGTVAVSPDGRSVYVASYFDGAIVRFDRSTAAGSLTPAGCIQDAGKAGCGASTHPALDGAFGVGISPEGGSVYVAAFLDDALVSFARDAASGALTPTGCIQDAGRADCGATQQGLDGAAWVAVSPDGGSVYTQGQVDDAVVVLDRRVSVGALTPAGCIQDAGHGACPSTTEGLDGTAAVALSPDGRSLYALSGDDDALVHFDREPVRPQTTIGTAPKQRTTRRTARFTFESPAPGTVFECRLDRRAFAPCDSPLRVRASIGRHTFEVRAIDRFGNADESPARHRWRVVAR